MKIDKQYKYVSIGQIMCLMMKFYSCWLLFVVQSEHDAHIYYHTTF